MSESLQEGGFGFTDDFGRPRVRSHQQPQIQAPHIAQQLRRDKLRFFPGTSSLDNILEDHQQQHLQQQEPHIQGYESSSMMLSEMFNFQPGADLLGIPSHLHGKNGNIVNWKSHNSGSGNGNSITNDWYSGGRQAGVLNPNPHPHLTSLGVSKESGGNNNHAGHDDDHDNINNNVSNNNNTGNRHENNSGNNIGHHQISSINADAAAMQLFLMNPEPEQPSAPLHMLLPGPSADAHQLQQLHHNFSPTTAFSATANNVIPAAVQLQQLNWGGSGAAAAGSGVGKLRNWGGGGETEGGKIAENQGLSLSLSSLQHLEAAMHGGEGAAAAVAGGKAEELRMDGVVYYPPQAHQSGLYALKSGIVANSVVGAGGGASVPGLQALQVHLGSSPMASVSIHSSMILRNSKYLRAAQELLEEFCSVGRGQIKSRRVGKQESSKWGSTNNTGDTNPSSSQSPHAPLSSSDRFEHQRKKTKLLAMLDEVDRRYNHYCEQMQQVVNSFDSVLGIGAALPYTCLAQKAMSRHFRCLRDAIAGQLRTTSELLGEKDVSGLTGITKGETPRLRLLDQTLRQQRAFHQMGMMEQEAWRPQRGLPERSVNILRAWLFEHFLHPYPSDADKHLLARQTGLSRNQVSNWFINARVRLWKPMVEEMYQEEAKDDHGASGFGSASASAAAAAATGAGSAAAEGAAGSAGKRCDVNMAEKDATANPAQTAINKHPNLAATLVSSTSHHHTISSQNDAGKEAGSLLLDDSPPQDPVPPLSGDSDSFEFSGRMPVDAEPGLSLPVGYGGNGLYHGRDLSHISLTLGLRHAGGLPEQSRFAVRPGGRGFKAGESQLLRDFAG